jgi:3-hydroxymyristoyl/3-hydroxydecanoyl-(acyl carrier protein) dehydratase
MKLNKKKIISLSKIKDPFLMIDSISNIVPLKAGIGKKKISKKSWFFKCHFTNNPMMPGSLIQESILQTIVSILYSNKKFKNKICLIISAKTNFYLKVNKQNELKIFVKILKLTDKKVEANATVYDKDKKKIANGLYKYFITYNLDAK